MRPAVAVAALSLCVLFWLTKPAREEVSEVERWLAKCPHLSACDVVDETRISGGLSNTNFILRLDCHSQGTVDAVMRIAGDAGEKPSLYEQVHRIDRRLEEALNRVAHAHGLTPKLLAYSADSGIMVTSLVAGQTLTTERMRDPVTLPAVLKLLFRLHSLPLVELGMGDVDEWRVKMFSPLQRAHARRSYLRDLFASRDSRIGARVLPAFLDDLFDKADRVDSVLRATAGAPVPIQGDVTPSNIIDDGSRLWLIDYEYSAVGERYYELASVSGMNGFNSTEEKLMVDVYLDILYENGIHAPSTNVVLARLLLMKFLNNVMEGMWGLSQHFMTRIPFEATWTHHTSYWEYGLDYLEGVRASSTSPDLEAAIGIVSGAARTE